jgi:hypothetical protein
MGTRGSLPGGKASMGRGKLLSLSLSLYGSTALVDLGRFQFFNLYQTE